MKILDQLVALRVLYLLVTPFERQEAFKLGVIDSHGDAKLAIKDMTPQQQASYTMLHRLCFRLKKVLGILPFGKTNLASMTAAYVLVRECADKEEEPENLEEIYKERYSNQNITLTECSIQNIEEIEDFLNKFDSITNDFLSLTEEGGAAITTTSGISAAATNTPVIKMKKGDFTVMRRKNDKKKEWLKENGYPDTGLFLSDETDEYVFIS